MPSATACGAKTMGIKRPTPFKPGQGGGPVVKEAETGRGKEAEVG
jgi:hypothetical protein